MTRRRLTKFRLDEIALCDEGAQTPARVALLKRRPDPEPSKEPHMSTPADQTEIPVLKSKVQALETELAKAKREATLTDAQRAHAAKLTGEDRDAFIAKSHVEREAVLKAAADADPEIYKSKAGRSYRASEREMADMAKRLDDQEAEIAKAKEAQADAEFAKRAATELAGYAAEEAAKVALLKAVASIKDDAVRAKATEMLAAGNAALAKTAETRGTVDGGKPAADTPAGRYEEGLEAFAKANPTLKGEAVEAQFLKTADGRKLYAARESSN